MKYTHVLFDLDGTLTDPKIGITSSVAYALKYFDIAVEDLDSLCPFIGPPLRDSFQEFYGFNSQQTTLAIQKFREYYEERGMYEASVYPGIPELLQQLKAAGATLLTATSKPTFLAGPVLEHFGLLSYLDFVSGSDPNEAQAEKFQIISHALKQGGMSDLNRVVMVGDRKFDVLGAKRAGIRSTGVLFGYGSREELEAADPDYLAETVSDLHDYLLED